VARRERLEDEARRAVSRARTDEGEAGAGGEKKKRTRRRASKLSPQSATTLRAALGKGAPKAESRLSSAAGAFEAERFGDAQRILRDLRRDAPQVPEIRELLGLTYYRLGKWKEAVGELEDFASLTGDPDQHPVLADCHRALENWDRVDELWIELRDASPSAEIVTEGRIVAAGAAADRGDVAKGVRILEKGWTRPKRPRPHHLRRAYALADLYERSGELPRARELFEWVASQAPDLADVRARVDNLG
jgi:tetratricopeptide (TPR) repeat protein